MLKLDSLSYLAATILTSAATILLIVQGRYQVSEGRIAIACAMAASAWFLFRLIKLGILSRGRRRELALSTTAVIAGCYLLGLLTLYFVQDRLLFFPPNAAFSDCEQAKGAGYRFIDTRQSGYRVRALVKEKPEARGWVTVFHGNAENACAAYLEYGLPLEALPLNIALAEYPGFGGDLSPLSQDALTQNAVSLFDLIRSENGKQLPVFAFGRSLGTGIATYLAANRPIQGLVLISPYTSISEVAEHQYPFVPVSLLLKNKFPAEQWAAEVKAPVLVVHGTDDHTIPFAIGMAESQRFHGLMQFVKVPGVGHNDVLDSRTVDVWREVEKFVLGRLSKN